MRIIFTGSGEFGIPTLQALLAAGHEIPVVFTQPDRPAGRGRKLTPTPIGQFALQHKLPFHPTASINQESLPSADAMVVIAFGQKVGPQAVGHPQFGSLNLHASLLPKYRGAAPINWAILRGETTTGNSVIRLAQKMDAGAILAQSEISIGDLETAGQLHDRLAIDGANLVLAVLANLQSGRAIETPQDESQATQAPKLTRDVTKINWTQPAEQIARQIRGLYPWPGCRARLLDAGGSEKGKFTLVLARPKPTNEGTRWHGGEITLTGDIATGDSSKALEILQIQPDGGRAMPVEDYRRGHAWMPGMRLEST